MKGDNLVVGAVGIFFAGFSLREFAEVGMQGVKAADMAGAVATLIAAFAGAWFAYRYQLESQRKKISEDERTALNLTIFELSKHHNRFFAIWKQFLHEYQDHPSRHLMIRPVAGGTWKPMELDFSKLAFLLESVDPNLLGELSLLEADVSATLGTIQLRSDMHLNVLQPSVEAVCLKHAGQIDAMKIEAELGERRNQQLLMLTDFMYQGVEDALNKTTELGDRLYQRAKERFPGEKVIRFIGPPRP